MRPFVLPVAILVFVASVAAWAPAASASPCHTASECINRGIQGAQCWDDGGDPFADPFNWTPGRVVVCLLAVAS